MQPSLPTPDTASKTSFFRFRGMSMWPGFQAGDLLIVETAPIDRLRRGDCIIYRSPIVDEYIIHRIVRIHPQIITQGDALDYLDEPSVAPDWVIGRVRERVRVGKHSRVWNGGLGMVARVFYRNAGRLDPTRPSRGGKLARLCRRICWPIVGHWVRRKTRIVRFNNANGGQTIYLMLGTDCLATQTDQHPGWVTLWPHSLWVDASSLPLDGSPPS